MPDATLVPIVRYIRRVVRLPGAEHLEDCALLDRFVADRDEEAFACLVRRHGSMVMGVCRRILADPHDAEDAFQATFLVLVRKARSIGRPELLGPWLYGVAQRTALHARTVAVRRRARQRLPEDLPAREAQDDNAGPLGALLDEELNRLPARYRSPVVLCYLEGKTREEASRHLGWSVGTVKGRLERGRNLLRKRLTRRGLALSVAVLMTAVTKGQTCVPDPLVVSTIKAATQVAAGDAAIAGPVAARVAALTQGVLRAMFMTKLKVALVVLLAGGILCSAVGLLAQGALAEKPGDAKKKDGNDAAANPGKKGSFPLPSGDVVGFTGKGEQPMALERTYPGICGALALTEEQKKKIQEVKHETIDSAAVREAASRLKTNPDATEQQKEAARNVIKEARAKLDQKVAAILTDQQKALVAKINDLSKEVQQSVLDEFQPEFAANKGNDAKTEELRKQCMEKLQVEFPRKLEGLLTPEQKASYEKAAAAQKLAEEEGKKNKKGKN